MTDQSVPIQLEFTADRETARRAASALARVALTRALMTTLLVVAALIGLAIVVGAAIGLPGINVWFGIVLLALVVISPLLNLWQASHATAKVFRAGARIGVGFSPDRIRIATVGSDSTVDPRIFRGIRRVGDFVILGRTRHSVVLLPGQAVPPVWFEHLEATIGGSRI